ncbi:MAG: hypothetical protein RR482_10510, partial [Clostridia bacterium]
MRYIYYMIKQKSSPWLLRLIAWINRLKAWNKGMHAQNYYRLSDALACDTADETRGIWVNCTGISAISPYFTTNNQQGRADYYLLLLWQGELEI